MIFDFRAGSLKKLFAANQVTTTFTVPAASELPPDGDGFYTFKGSTDSPQRVLLLPIGTAAENKTFSFILYFWRRTIDDMADVNKKGLYLPYPIAAFDCTLGLMTGLAGKYIDNTQFFADTIAASTNGIGTTPHDYGIRSPADNSAGSVDVAGYGGDVMSATFAIGTSQATGANLLVAPL